MKTATINGIELTYRDEGSGRALLLAHAFPLSGAMWQPQLAALSNEYRVIAPDLRGFGASQLGTAPDSLDQYADDLAALLDHLELDKVAFVGLSMGGYIAFAFLRRYPERVDALILADTRAEADSDEAKHTRERNAQLAETDGAGAVTELMLPKLLADSTAESQHTAVRLIGEANIGAGLAAALRAMAARPDSTGDLAAIHVPTLVIVGAEDTLVTPDEARAMRDAIAGSKYVEIANAAHLSNIEAPDVFNDAVRDVLRS